MDFLLIQPLSSISGPASWPSKKGIFCLLLFLCPGAAYGLAWPTCLYALPPPCGPKKKTLYFIFIFGRRMIVCGEKTSVVVVSQIDHMMCFWIWYLFLDIYFSMEHFLTLLTSIHHVSAYSLLRHFFIIEHLFHFGHVSTVGRYL